MNPDVNEAGAGTRPPPGAPDRLRLWNRGVDGLAALGTALIVLLMAIIVADVIARNLLGSSLPLIAELGALTVVMIVFLQLGTAIRNDRLAATEFFLDAMRARNPRAALMVRALWDLVGAAVCAGIAWASWGILLSDIDSREYIGIPGVMTMQTSPFRALILIGAIAAAMQFVIMAARRLGEARRSGDSAR